MPDGYFVLIDSFVGLVGVVHLRRALVGHLQGAI
jgi:hypothetical protein